MPTNRRDPRSPRPAPVLTAFGDVVGEIAGAVEPLAPNGRDLDQAPEPRLGDAS